MSRLMLGGKTSAGLSETVCRFKSHWNLMAKPLAFDCSGL